MHCLDRLGNYLIIVDLLGTLVAPINLHKREKVDSQTGIAFGLQILGDHVHNHLTISVIRAIYLLIRRYAKGYGAKTAPDYN